MTLPSRAWRRGILTCSDSTTSAGLGTPLTRRDPRANPSPPCTLVVARSLCPGTSTPLDRGHGSRESSWSGGSLSWCGRTFHCPGGRTSGSVTAMRARCSASFRPGLRVPLISRSLTSSPPRQPPRTRDEHRVLRRGRGETCDERHPHRQCRGWRGARVCPQSGGDTGVALPARGVCLRHGTVEGTAIRQCRCLCLGAGSPVCAPASTARERPLARETGCGRRGPRVCRERARCDGCHGDSLAATGTEHFHHKADPPCPGHHR